MTHVDETVDRVVADYLALADSAVPGLVEGLYLLGSVALGDFRPAHSDIDFLAVTGRHPRPGDLAALREVHARLGRRHTRPFFDGLYLTRDQLGRPPSAAGPVPCVHEHRFQEAGGAGLDPVTWHTLADSGLAVRGPRPTELGVWTDRTALIDWTAGNVEAYWVPWRRAHAALLSPRGLVALSPWAAMWAVLGLARMEYTVRTGAVASKSYAGEVARDTAPPRWHRVLDECLRLRRGGGGRSVYRTPLHRRRDVLGFVDAAVDRVRGRDA